MAVGGAINPGETVFSKIEDPRYFIDSTEATTF
jgi:hypothetical protein